MELVSLVSTTLCVSEAQEEVRVFLPHLVTMVMKQNQWEEDTVM
tara:strand:- start:383 stop:514 length:132 start_codon:yes stop_codon:yes gene_type:complete